MLQINTAKPNIYCAIQRATCHNGEHICSFCLFFIICNLNDFIFYFKVDSSPKKTRTKNAALSWSRLSMRRTCPIVMPEPNSPKDATRYHNTTIARTTSSINPASNRQYANQLSRSICDENNGNDCFDGTMSSTATSTPCLFQLNYSENNHMSYMLNDHVLSTESYGENQLPELSSLNSEFLSTIFTTPNYGESCSNASVNMLSQHETNFGHDIDESGRTAVATATSAEQATAVVTTQFEESRPRQLGRRSEMRSRIVSITAERNAEGNHVSTSPNELN